MRAVARTFFMLAVKYLVPRTRIELVTQGFSGPRSTD